MEAYLILEQGRVLQGQGFGAAGETIAALCFNTAMAGYTELLSDPCYAGQALVLTYPLIGNAGVCRDDFQSRRLWADALIVSELSDTFSNFRGEEPLAAALERFSIPGLQGVDVRSLVRLLRDKGALRGMITRDRARVDSLEDTLAQIRAWTPPDPSSLDMGDETVYNPEGQKTVAVLDTGLKRSVIDSLTGRGLRIRTYRADTAAGRILTDKPDGVLLAEGPGDPERYTALIETVKILFASDIPLAAIGLGYELLALATGAKIRRLTRGHHGANYPARNLKTGRVAITAQSHDYVVDTQSLDPSLCELSHVNVNDGTAEGLYYPKRGIRSLAYNPEVCGTAEEREFFDRFAAECEVR